MLWYIARRFGKIIKDNENDDEEIVESELGPNGPGQYRYLYYFIPFYIVLHHTFISYHISIVYYSLL